jgi:hypothetical protein
VIGIPADSVSFDVATSTLQLTINARKASYTGHLTPAGMNLTGQWKQGQVSVPVNFSRKSYLPTERPLARTMESE